MISQFLLSTSAAIVLLAGTLHLHGIFFGSDLRPSDPSLEARMRKVAMNVSDRTTYQVEIDWDSSVYGTRFEMAAWA